MKKFFLPSFIVIITLFAMPAYSQSGSDTAALGLPGDNLDLYGVLTLFQTSKTIEAFEQSLNEQKTGLNNLDLDLDGKVDFIKVITKQKDSSFQFILQIAVNKNENQDVAVILVNKDKKGNVHLQIVGDEALYGKDYVIEPSPNPTSSVTANPAYKGPDPIVVNVPATETIVVQSAPIVQYVYSPAYVPYYPPYYYGYYPPYFAAFTVMAVGIYRHNHYYHHHGYYGGHYHGGNTVIINDRDNFNNYNNNKMRSNTVADNKARGNYDRGNGAGGRGSASTRPSAGTSNRPGAGSGASASQRPTTNPAFNRSGTTPSVSNNQFNKSSNRASTGSSFSSRPSTSNYSSGAGRTRSSGGISGGGGRTGGGGRRR